jgi:acyl carrier protein
MNNHHAAAIELIKKSLNKYIDISSLNITEESLLADIGIDSLTLVELLFEIEDDLGVSIAEQASKPTTILDLIKIIQPYLGDLQAT